MCGGATHAEMKALREGVTSRLDTLVAKMEVLEKLLKSSKK